MSNAADAMRALRLEFAPPVPARDALRYARERAIRAVVAAQWGLAVMLFSRYAIDVEPDATSDYERGAQDVACDIARLLPTPEQIVGDEPPSPSVVKRRAPMHPDDPCDICGRIYCDHPSD